MRIFHKSKRAVPPHPQVADLISELLNTRNDELAAFLSSIDAWRWPRSDLNAWIKVLNKFDAILEEAIQDYRLDELQLKSFAPTTKKLVSEVLRFERMLLENSTNRKMFSSYDRLNSLLFTSDLDIMILALNLLLRPAQQYSNQPSVSHALNISTPRLQSLAKKWPYLREYGVGLTELSTLKGSQEVDALPVEAREVNFTFYRTDSSSVANDKDKGKKAEMEASDSIHHTPRKFSQSASVTPFGSGAVNVHIDEQTLAAKPAMDILKDAIDAYKIPDGEKFEVLCRIRAAQVLAKGNQADREKLVIIRLLAIAIYGHTHTEAQALSSIFLFEPDLVTHIAEVLQVDRGIPITIQTVAIAALDSLARYRGKIQEILAAVNAGVNHGILMALVRKTVADVANLESTIPHSFVEALLSFVTYVATHAAGGNLVVGAGLVPLLIQVIENRLPQRLPMVSKTMQLVDNVLYSFTNAFQLFCNARGVEVLVDRIEYEVDQDITQYGDKTGSQDPLGSYGELPVACAAVLKHTLRSMHRMMQSSGTAEGLRGLIDMSLLKSIKRIIQYRGLFGPSVLPMAINIMSTFIHNEPTSLPIIQEAGVPETLYTAIEAGLEPAIEVLQAIPNAIGALCLNDAGQRQLASHPSIIPGIFAVFTSERHLKVLLDKENAVLLGTAIDELIRHHPSLKAPVFESLKSSMTKIEDLGNAYVVPDNLKQWYHLVASQSPQQSFLDTDVAMEDAELVTENSTPEVELPADDQEVRNEAGSSAGDDGPRRSHDNNIVSFIDVLGRFLEGLFQHIPHCRDFITTTDGLKRLGRLTALPCLPYDFANSLASDSMVQIMRTMTEVATNETLIHLTKLVKESLDDTKTFWSTFDDHSKLLPLVDISEAQEQEANAQFRNLVTLHIRNTLLSDVFATAGYAHGRAAINLLQTLMSNAPSGVISELGALHRASIWENIVLKSGLSAKGIDVVTTPSVSPLEGSPSQTNAPLPETGGIATTNGIRPESSDDNTAPSPQKEAPKADGPKEHNAAALKHLAHGLPASLAPFFQALVKMFHARRNPDAVQKKQIAETSVVVADIMLKHITRREFDDISMGYTYYSIMLGLITTLLVDERTATNTLHTVPLFALYRAGGLEAIFDICQIFMTSIESITKTKAEDRSGLERQILFHAYGGLRVALHLIHPIIASKPLFESGQTLLIITREKKDIEPDYFEPHNFLVRLRLVALPTLRALWEAPWLVSAPSQVSKAIVQSVLEIINGENEEPKSDNSSEGAPVPSGVSRPTGPDENRVRQLTDMGFPRSAAERALIRTHNNLTAATEFLLSQPYPLPPDPDPVAPEPLADADAIPVDDAAPSSEADQEGSDIPIISSENESSPPIEHPQTPGKTAAEWRKELEEAREPLKKGISRQALVLVDEHPHLIFDLHVAFTRTGDAHQQHAVKDLVDDVAHFSPFAYDVQEQPLANRCQLLAWVLWESPSSMDQGLRGTLMKQLLALLLSSPVSSDPGQHNIPKWLAAHLLVTETLLTLSEEPRTIDVPKQEDAIVSEALFTGPPLTEARTMILDFCLRLLAIPNLPNVEFISCLRLLVLLTRHGQLASQFIKQDGLGKVLTRIRTGGVFSCSSYIAIILRHVVEDPGTVQHVMRQAIKRYFSQPRTRIVDVNTFVRNCNPMAFRDPEAFLQATAALCTLGQHFSSSPHINLKPDTPSDEKPPVEGGTLEMQVDTPSISVHESAEVTVHLLLAELMRVSKGLTDLPNKPSSEPAVAQPSQPSSSLPPDLTRDGDRTPEFKNHDLYEFSCFLMQCLTELLFSYETCKLAFLSYSPKKRNQPPAKETAKYRTAALHFLLSELIAFSSINSQTTSEVRDRNSACNWAMSVIVALCVDTSSNNETKEVSSDLLSVRKFVLEAVSRAIKDAPPAESTEARYGRLLALADLCHRLLTVKFNITTRKPADDAPTHIAKIMLEKNFVATLTNALAEVDLNYPNVKGLVTSILRPLEHLSRTAIKMGRTSGKAKESLQDKTEMDETYETDEEEVEEDDREETPDLYRNSVLGMYGGEMEDTHFNADEDMDEDVEDDEDVEMDFGDETGSEDTSNTDDDEGEDDELAEETREPGDAWDDEEDDGDLVEQEDGHEEEGDEPSEEGEDEDDPNAEIMWRDYTAEGSVVDDGGEDVEEERGVTNIPIIHEEEDDRGPMSDEEDYHNMGTFQNGRGDPDDDMFGFVEFGTVSRTEQGIIVRQRHRITDYSGGGMHFFGRPANAPPPAPEATTHPLLLDTSSTTNRVSAPNSRSARPAQRVVAAGTGDLLQALEGLIGGGAVQLFQQIMTRGRGGGGPETIRLDVPASAVINLDRAHPERRSYGVLPSGVRVERASHHADSTPHGIHLEPLLTLQRWAEEAKILNGEYTSNRVGKLVNHLIVTLLPAAVEAAKQTAIKEEQQAKLREEQAKAEVETEPEPGHPAAEAANRTPQTSEPINNEQTDVGTTGEVPTNESVSMEISNEIVPDADTEMIDVSARPSATSEVETSSSNQDNMTTIQGANESTTDAAEPSNAPQRVTVLIHGNPVDITDTGIDPTFLEALPDDMREEVLNQHVRDQRAARVERPPDSQISAEFLDALPPDIRAEIIQQERIEQARRRAEESAPSQGPADIDPASFIASLDPQLRQVVLLDQDDGFIQTLPSHMIAEAGMYREGQQARRHFPVRSSAQPVPPAGSSFPRKPLVHHDAIQLLDKAGIAALVRLLFFPQVLKKNLLHKVLVHLCENAKTRTELFNLLLSILQDGTGDLTAVDKSFAQMSVRNTKPQTPKAAGKQRTGSDYLSALALPQNEIVPELIAQRCLECLTYIVSANELASLFFLTEHELPAGLKKTASKKGKGKEKQAPQTHYPIVLLLGLLDRQSLLKTPMIMEAVVGLLALVTRPLASLKDSSLSPDETASATSATATGTAQPPSNSQDSTEPSGIIPPVTPAPQTALDASTDVTSQPSAPNPSLTPVDNQATTTPQPSALSIAAVEEKILLANPPQIPHAVLRLIVNILTIGECSGRTFQQSLALIQHLSYIPDARDVIAQELKSKAQDFGQCLYTDLDELANALVVPQNDGMIGSVASKFSAPSSVQAKLLRVLKTIDYMYSAKSPSPISGEAQSNGDAEKVQGIYESFRFTPLWKRLGDCLTIIEEKSEMEHIATVLLPLIEALMVVCKYVGTKAPTTSAARALRASASPRSPTTPRETMEDLFITFTDAHRKILNLMVRNNPSLMSGSFSLLVHNPRVLDFDNKRNYFSQQLHKRSHSREHYGTLQLNVRRARVFEDSFQYLQRKTGEQIKYGKLSVRFYDEEGVDAGGVTREWFQILARQMFDPNNALFQPCAADRLTYQPNKNSWVNPEHLSFFKFVGRVIGKAIYDGRLLDAYFARSLYRQILGKPVDYRDVEWVDPEYYNSLCWILENDPTPLELTFSVEADEFGVNRIVPLKEGGEGIHVTLENRKEFVQLSAQYRLYSSIKDQIENLLAGFYEIIPKDLITIFNEQELELLISGTPDIDVDEWRAATEYNGYTSSDPVIVWWWRALKSFNREERAKVLSFATGTSRVPLGGFIELQGVQGVQRFSIHRAYGEPDRLPQAHTCFNQIDLPQYSSYEMLRQQLLMAIIEGGEGFSFA